MNNKVTIILNAVLLVAVGVLYVLHFSGSQQTEGEPTSTGSDITFGNFDNAIAYINSDSLLSNYEYFKLELDKLEEKREKLEAELQNRAQGLQTEINNFQQSANNMTIGQARAVEEDLMKKQQNLRVYQENLRQQILQEEAKLNEELYSRVSEYLDDYGKENRLKLVLTYTKGSGVLFADDSLNITQRVIAGLNQEFEQETSGGETNASSTQNNQQKSDTTGSE